jgi:hypothetical protein
MLHIIIVDYCRFRRGDFSLGSCHLAPNNPSGFILTTVLGIAGAFLATFIGQAIGHYDTSQGAGASPHDWRAAGAVYLEQASRKPSDFPIQAAAKVLTALLMRR